MNCIKNIKNQKLKGGGVKNFFKMIDQFNVKKPLNLQEIRGSRIAIDTSILIHKFNHSIQTTSIEPQIVGILNFLPHFIKLDIKLLFVFEGARPNEKAETLLKRATINHLSQNSQYTQSLINASEENSNILKRNRDRSTSHDNLNSQNFSQGNSQGNYSQQNSQIKTGFQTEHIKNLKKLFKIIGINQVDAKGEAEAECFNLFNLNYVDYVLSTDSDCLIQGNVKLILKDADLQSLIDGKEVMNKLKMSREEIVDQAILCGTDYNENLKNINIKKAQSLIDKYKNIENVLNHLWKNNKINREGKNKFERIYIRVREMFLTPDLNQYPSKIELKTNLCINQEALKLFLSDRNFKLENIESRVLTFKNSITENKQVSQNFLLFSNILSMKNESKCNESNLNEEKPVRRNFSNFSVKDFENPVEKLSNTQILEKTSEKFSNLEIKDDLKEGFINSRKIVASIDDSQMQLFFNSNNIIEQNHALIKSLCKNDNEENKNVPIDADVIKSIKTDMNNNDVNASDNKSLEDLSSNVNNNRIRKKLKIRLFKENFNESNNTEIKIEKTDNMQNNKRRIRLFKG